MVGKSKVISGLNDWQAHRRRKDTIMGSSVGPDAYAQTREPKGTIGELFQPTFHAGLTNNDSAKTPGGNFLEATVVRGTSASYIDRNGILQLAGPNESRQEYANGQALGTLMEPASTNKCDNYNANPDAALSFLSTQGDPAGVMSRVDDSAELAAAGLNATVTEGFVVRLDNSGGSGVFEALVEGNAGNTNEHQCSIYWRGTGSGRLRTTGTPGAAVPLPGTYEYYSVSETPAAGTNRLRITAEAGAVLYFILNQFEEQPVATSSIITSGAAASRDTDQLSWPLNGILNQSQGMASVRATFGWSFDDTVAGQQQSFITFRAGEVSLLYHNNSSGTSQLVSRDDAATFAIAVFPPGKPEAGEHYLLMVRWGNGTFQVGFKVDGAVTWGATQSYVGRFDEEGEMYFSFGTKLPLHGRDLYVWSEDRGTAWLESFFSGIAN